MRIIIGTKNQAKITGATRAFEKYFDNVEIIPFSAESNVSEQPVDKDIYLGAKNRALNCIDYAKSNNISADYYIAIESGLANFFGKHIITNVAIIYDNAKNEYYGTSAGFPVPNKYVQEIKDTNLGEVIDKIFEKSKSRQNGGGISLLSHNVINRIDLSYEAFVMALTQIINGEIWRD